MFVPPNFIVCSNLALRLAEVMAVKCHVKPKFSDPWPLTIDKFIHNLTSASTLHVESQGQLWTKSIQRFFLILHQRDLVCTDGRMEGITKNIMASSTPPGQRHKNKTKTKRTTVMAWICGTARSMESGGAEGSAIQGTWGGWSQACMQVGVGGFASEPPCPHPPLSDFLGLRWHHSLHPIVKHLPCEKSCVCHWLTYSKWSIWTEKISAQHCSRKIYQK